MKRIIARIVSFFSSPQKDLEKIASEIGKLKNQMIEIRNMPNKVEALVKLFQVISPLQDAGGFKQTIFALQQKNYGQLDKIIAALNTLQIHFGNAGRSDFGWNRTQTGEEVTAAKVFLGNIFGIWTKPAAYWLEHEEELKKDEREDLTKEGAEKPVTTWYCINDHQAGNFLERQAEGILQQIKIIQTATV